MNILEFLVLLLVAGVCGVIGQMIAGKSVGGFVISIIVGFIGAIFGRWIAGAMGLPVLVSVQIGGNDFPIIWAIVGSTLFVAIVVLLTGRRG